MSTPVFRLATAADAYEIAVMSRYLVEVGLRGWSWHPERVAKAIRARDTSVVVVEVKENLVGFAIMEFGDIKAHLSLLAVKPSHQRCSIGRQMVDWLEETALVAGISTINLELRANNFGARCFYKMLGFKEMAYIPGYYRGVETAVKMSRDIRRAIPQTGQLTPGSAA
ncbi:MAG: GNAT family N-acetyltransferase [Betaproteobacteria bacterium]|nr:GNAT family N-acetyltransferase [Betaproteobacteria bacterium]